MNSFNDLYGAARKHTSKENALALATRHYRRPESRIKSFGIDINKSSIIKKADGNTYIEGVLTDIFKDSDGKKTTEKLAKKIVEQINTVGINAFIKHDSLDKLEIDYMHLEDEAFIEKAREREGLLDNIKAIYEKGKVWIKGLVKSEFVNKIKDITKMSIELFVPPSKQVGNEYVDGDVIGIALTNKPRNNRASFKLVSE